MGCVRKQLMYNSVQAHEPFQMYITRDASAVPLNEHIILTNIEYDTLS